VTASWPAFIIGVALVFLLFNAAFAPLYRRRLYRLSLFSIETLSTAGYGDMHPQTHYGHFIATVELFDLRLLDVADDRADLRALFPPSARLLLRRKRSMRGNPARIRTSGSVIVTWMC
jgi:Ion channel